MLPLNNPEDVNLKAPSPAQPTFGDVASAGFELAMQETFVTTYARDTALDEMNTGKTLTPDEANEKYPYVEVKFDQPVNEQAAYFLNEEAYRRHELRQTIEQGPTGSGAVNFVAGSVAHLLDPVEFAAGAVTGMGLTRVAGMAAKSSSTALANLGRTIAQPATVGGTFAREAVENTVGNAIAESYIVAKADRAQMDYDLQDAFVNSVAAGILGGALSTGIKYGAKGLNSVIGKSEIATDIALKSTVSQLEGNVKPTPGIVETAWKDLAYGEPRIGATSNTNYVFKPVNLADLPNQSFFAPTKMTNSMDGGTRTFGHDFGEGITLTDNPNIANNVAGHALEEGMTSIAEVRINEAKLIDLDTPTTSLDPEVIGLREALPENLRPYFENVETLRQGIDNIRGAIDEGSLKDVDFENMNAAIKGAGFDGYKLAVSEGKQQFNQIHLFPESGSKAQASGYRKVDADALPELDADTLNKTAEYRLDKKSQLGFDDDVQIEADNLVVPKEINEAEISKQINENFATLERMEQQGLLSEDVAGMVAEMKKERSFYEKLPEMVNEFTNCLLGGN